MPIQFFAIAGGIAGGLSGYFGANERNDDIRNQYRLIDEAYNKNINRARVASHEDRRLASQRYESGVGAVTTAMNYGNFRSGHSIKRLYQSQNANYQQDDIARKNALAYSVENLQTQKVNAAAQSTNQLVNVGNATLSGAIQGAQAGAGLDALSSNVINSFKDSSFLKDLNSQLGAGNISPELTAQANAIASGVPISIVRQYPGIATSPFLGQLRLQGMQMGGLNNTLDFASSFARSAEQGASRALQDLSQLQGSAYLGGR